MRIKKKNVLCCLLTIAIVFGLIPMVGISRISGMDRISDDNNPILNNFAKATTNNNLIEEKLNNVTSAAVREVGDEDYLSPEPPAAAPAEGSKEEAEVVSYSATIPKGMTAVEQLTDGRISVGGYALYTGIMTAILTLVKDKSKVSHTTFVIHIVSGVSMWIVNFLIVFWLLTAREGQLISTGWSVWLERILYFTLAAGPFILLHCLLAHLYTCEVPIVVMAGVGSTCRSAWEYCIQQLFTNGWGEDDLTNLLEEAGLTPMCW